jgi:hypothetical protein
LKLELNDRERGAVSKSLVDRKARLIENAEDTTRPLAAQRSWLLELEAIASILRELRPNAKQKPHDENCTSEPAVSFHRRTTTIAITDEISAASEWRLATALHLSSHDRRKLNAIAKGECKVIDVNWWRKIHDALFHADPARLKRKADLEARADPARNPNPHECAIAAKKLANLMAEVPPSAPGLEEHDRTEAGRRKMKTSNKPKQRPNPEKSSNATSNRHGSVRATRKSGNAHQRVLMRKRRATAKGRE